MNDKLILVMEDGSRIRVTGDDRKWWIADGRKFRKLSAQISAVIRDAPNECTSEETLVEAISDVKNTVAKPNKKTAPRKKKPSEKVEV